MNKVERYRQIYNSFKTLCSEGRQPSSFQAYCIGHGVSQSQMPYVLKGEYQPITALPGYSKCSSVNGISPGLRYRKVYEDFKNLCAQGRQPGSFSAYCRANGVTRKQMHNYLRGKGLTVTDIPGFKGPHGIGTKKCDDIPFEEVIFQESGFVPAETCDKITVKVDDRLSVSFPADTDIAVIVRFVKKIEKEAGHVGT